MTIKITTLIILLDLLLSAQAHATEYSGSDAQATETSLEQNGGGEFHVSTFYNSTSPLIISELVPTTINGDGWATGFNYGNPAGYGNVWQIGTGNYSGDFVGKNLVLANYPVNGVVPPYVTGVFATQSAAPYFENMIFQGFYTSTWFSNTWAPKFHHVRFQNGTFGPSFDNVTPANNTTLDQCEAFGMSGSVVLLSDGSNGLYLQNGDYEADGYIVAEVGTAPVNNLVIDRNDIEGLTGGLIYNPNGAPLNNLVVTNNTWADSGTITISHANGGKLEGNLFWNTNLVVTQSQNTNFSFSCDKNVFTGTSTCTVN